MGQSGDYPPFFYPTPKKQKNGKPKISRPHN